MICISQVGNSGKWFTDDVAGGYGFHMTQWNTIYGTKMVDPSSANIAWTIPLHLIGFTAQGRSFHELYTNSIRGRIASSTAGVIVNPIIIGIHH
jgi:hypothetical protein